MKDYRQFIKQLPTNTVVCALGEFNPPTTAHELLIKTAQVVAEQRKSDHIVFTTSTELISEEKKEQFLKLMFPKTKFQSLGESFFASTIKSLTEKYRKVVIIAGADQFSEFKKLKESANVEIISIGTKDPDVDNTKMKQYATKGYYEDFKKLLPSTIRDIDGRRLMNEMRLGLNLEPIKEQLVLVKDKLREDYFKGKIFNVGDIVESNGQQYQIVKRGSNHLLLKEESGELVSKWITDVKQVKEAVIQSNGTDKIEPNAPESDTGAKQEMTPKGKTKGFITFYNYKTGGTPTEGSRSGNINAVGSENSRTVREHCGCEDETTQVPDQSEIYRLNKVGNGLVDDETPRHLRRMKVKHHLGEETIDEQMPTAGAIGSMHTGSMHHTRTPATDKFHDKAAKQKIKATLALKHAKEKENLSHKQEKERLSLQNEDIDIPKDAPSVEAIAKKHGVSVDEIKQQLAVGMKVEAEHGKNSGSEREIALDHLNEKPDYYKKLKRFVEGVPSPTGDLKNACWKGYTAVGTKKKNGKTVPNCVPVNEWVVKHDGVDANHPDETTRKLFSGKKDIINHLTKYKDSAEKRAKLLQGKGFKNVRIEETKLNPLDPHGDYQAKSKALQDIQLDPHTHKDPQLSAELIRSKAALEKEYEPHRVKKEEFVVEEKPEEKDDRIKQLKRFKDQAKGSLLTQDRPGIGTENNPYNDPFFKEEEIDDMVNSVTDSDIEELYEEDEIVLVYEDTGEEVEHHPDESKIDLMEVLSRQERLKGKIRLRRTAAKRSRSTKIALKRFSPPATINKRARRLAIKLMKKRILRGRDYSKTSVGERERIEKMIKSRKSQIDRIAVKLVPRIRKVEKSRMSHGKVTKGAIPNVF